MLVSALQGLTPRLSHCRGFDATAAMLTEMPAGSNSDVTLLHTPALLNAQIPVDDRYVTL
jgi:hypothetical protein